MSNSKTKTQAQPSPKPSDVPAPTSALERLELLVGEWMLVAIARPHALGARLRPDVYEGRGEQPRSLRPSRTARRAGHSSTKLESDSSRNRPNHVIEGETS